MLACKQNVFDDFIAAAEWLIADSPVAYQDALDALIASGHAYPCACTRRSSS